MQKILTLAVWVKKILHSKDAGSSKNFLQKTDYIYNVRGWLRKINDPSLANDNDVFGMELNYENVSNMNGLAPSGFYNGNIAGMKWGVKNDMIRGYGFQYDELNLIGEADYAGGTDLSNDDGYYKVDNIDYDNNGNIMSLSRYAGNVRFDNLIYHYYPNSNQLYWMEDGGNTTAEADGYPNGTSGNYIYDENGNMKHDGGKNLNVSYNHLNLP